MMSSKISHPILFGKPVIWGVRSLLERFSQDVLLKRYSGIVDLWRMVSKAKAIGRGGEQKQTDDQVLEIRRAMSKLRSAGTRRFLIFAGLALLMGLVAASPVWGTVDTRSGGHSDSPALPTERNRLPDGEDRLLAVVLLVAGSWVLPYAGG